MPTKKSSCNQRLTQSAKTQYPQAWSHKPDNNWTTASILLVSLSQASLEKVTKMCYP